jgi:hypothetical protein
MTQPAPNTRFLWDCLRKASTAAQKAGAVWLGDERGFDERPCKPALGAEAPDPFGDLLRSSVELPPQPP